jgi:hypothetical protein
MLSLLPTKFHEILFSSFRGVVLTNCDGQTDRTKTMLCYGEYTYDCKLKKFRKMLLTTGMLQL